MEVREHRKYLVWGCIALSLVGLVFHELRPFKVSLLTGQVIQVMLVILRLILAATLYVLLFSFGRVRVAYLGYMLGVPTLT